MPQRAEPLEIEREVRVASSSGLPSHEFDDSELDRIQMEAPKLVGTQWLLSMDIEYPVVGVVYILRWKPRPSDAGSETATATHSSSDSSDDNASVEESTRANAGFP